MKISHSSKGISIQTLLVSEGASSSDISMHTSSATHTRLVGFTIIPASTLATIYANAMLFFDTDSSFWVCNNSATDHICNDKLLFSGAFLQFILSAQQQALPN